MKQHRCCAKLRPPSSWSSLVPEVLFCSLLHKTHRRQSLRFASVGTKVWSSAEAFIATTTNTTTTTTTTATTT